MNALARLAALAVCLAIFCPIAAATEPSLLALMPLPREALGPDAAALQLVKGSGLDSNADAARHAGDGFTAADLARAGRITGYTLDYARPGMSRLNAAHPLVEVQTIAELYRDEARATKGLAFWRSVTRVLAAGKPNGFTVVVSPFAARVGDGAFAFELTLWRGGKPRLYVGDIVFRTGDLLGAVFVTVTHDAGLRARSIELAGKLSARIQRVAAGKVQEPAVTLPAKN